MILSYSYLQSLNEMLIKDRKLSSHTKSFPVLLYFKILTIIVIEIIISVNAIASIHKSVIPDGTRRNGDGGGGDNEDDEDDEDDNDELQDTIGYHCNTR